MAAYVGNWLAVVAAVAVVKGEAVFGVAAEL